MPTVLLLQFIIRESGLEDSGLDVEEPSVAANDDGRVQNLLDLRETDE